MVLFPNNFYVTCNALLTTMFCFTELIFGPSQLSTFTWIKSTTTPTELAHCTPANYTFLSFPRTSANQRSSAATGGGTGILIREPFTQLPSSLPNFSYSTQLNEFERTQA